MINYSIYNPVTKKREPFSMPTKWEELTLFQLCLYFTTAKKEGKPKPGDVLYEITHVSSMDWLTILSGIPESTWERVDPKQAYELAQHAVLLLEEKQPDWSTLKWNPVLQLEGFEPIIIPDELSLRAGTPWIAVQNAETLWQNSKDEDLMYIPDFMATLLYEIATEETFDEGKIKPLSDAIAQTKAVETYPIANFFFLLFKKLQANGQKKLLRLSRNGKRSKRGLKGFRTLAS